MVLEKNISKYDKGILIAKFSFLPFMKRLSLQFTKLKPISTTGAKPVSGANCLIAERGLTLTQMKHFPLASNA